MTRNWEPLGACVGQDPRLWDADSDPALRLAGRQVCLTACPVVVECGADATPLDHVATTRGGECRDGTVCQRCGGPLPVGCHPRRQHCDECRQALKAARASEQQRRKRALAIGPRPICLMCPRTVPIGRQACCSNDCLNRRLRQRQDARRKALRQAARAVAS